MALGIYFVLFLISLVLTLTYALLWHKHFSVYHTLVFLVIPISLIGYVLEASAGSLEASLNGTKIIYIGGNYLLLFVLLSIFNICGIKYSKRLSVSLIGLSTFTYLTAFSVGFLPIFYKSASYVALPDGHKVIKEYGPMHGVFLAVVIIYFIVSIAAIVYSYFEKMEVPNSIIAFLLIAEIISVSGYFLGRFITDEIELIPFSYIVSQVMFLLIARKICMYDVTDSAIDSIVQAGETGIISLDFRYRYLGSNKTAKDIMPVLYDIRVDTPIEKFDELKDTFIPWIETFKADETDDKFYLKRGSKTYLVDINYLFNGNRMMGYQFLMTDDTKNQEYIALLDNYNSSLQKEVEEKTSHIREMSNRLILDMAIMVESRDNSTGGHIRRTADCVSMIVDEMKKDNRFSLSEEFYKNVIKAAPMHDLGKIAVDDAILRKPGRFTPEEFEEMKKHAAEGARIVHEVLKDTDDAYFHLIAENVAHYHHERVDGSGYPEGLKGDAIPLEARIMAIADVYDALVSKRVYKDSMSFEQANEIIMDGMGKHFDERLRPYYESARPKLEEYYSSLEETPA
ncbi:MAG: HD domain-containing protein [Lachnospiraceae bacterium]|nr:HD domain-containing protein [Lachnospiraceae bacterium]